MLGDTVLRWGACAGLSELQNCRLQWNDMAVMIGLFLVAYIAISLCLRLPEREGQPDSRRGLPGAWPYRQPGRYRSFAGDAV